MKVDICNCNGKSTSTKPQFIFARKKAKLNNIDPQTEKGYRSASMSCHMTCIVMLYTHLLASQSDTNRNDYTVEAA